jgi:hypothetical protein
MDFPHPLGPHPFSRAQILAAGLPAHKWREAIESGALSRLRRGVYVQETGRDDRTRYAQRVAAELVTRRDHFAIADSAAAFHELPNPWFAPWSSRPARIAGPRSRPDRGIEPAGRLEPVETPWGPAVDPVSAAIGVAADLPLPQALMVVDPVATLLAGTTDRFTLASQQCRTRVRRLLQERADLPVTRLADPAADSPAESFYRGHMLVAGFPESRCGVPRRGASGKQFFVDILLDGLAIEIDGAVKYTGLEALTAEKLREDDLRETGLGFHRVFVEHLFADPSSEMERLHNRSASHVRRAG